MVTPLGVVTEVPIILPTGTGTKSRPYDIISDPGGNLWFVTNNSQYIGEITNGGSTPPNYYKVKTTNPGLQGIAVGPDGALYFTETAANKIGRMTTAGDVTYEVPVPGPLPSGGALLGGITTGPDNNMWFTALGVPAIGSFTPPSGPITWHTITLSNPPTEPGVITVGPDNALWFTEPAEGAIGRITTTSPTAYSTFQPDLPIKPNGITQGPDGALWFTDGYGLIWRLH
jgi:virginiamycin B lyase